MSLRKEDRQTVSFLKMAAGQLRIIAEQTPAVAVEVLRVAEQLETEAAEIERREAGTPTH